MIFMKGAEILVPEDLIERSRAFVKKQKLKPVDNKRDPVSAKCAEIAFCLYVDIPYEVCFFDGYRAWDVIYLENNIDIKNNDQYDRRCVCEVEAARKGSGIVDLFVLMKGTIPRFQYFGWILPGDLIKPENLIVLNPKYPAPYSVHESAMDGRPIPRKGEYDAPKTND